MRLLPDRSKKPHPTQCMNCAAPRILLRACFTT
jgi:hypothetical protein